MARTKKAAREKLALKKKARQLVESATTVVPSDVFNHDNGVTVAQVPDNAPSSPGAAAGVVTEEKTTE